VWPEVRHGFDLCPGPMGAAAHTEMYAFLRTAVDEPEDQED
jgi:hypothetical protein